MESDGIHRILRNAMNSIESCGMQWNYKIRWNPLNFTWFCLHWHWSWCLSGLSEATRGVSGRSAGALGGHLTIFYEIIQKIEIASMPFSDNFEQMSNITLVLLMFLRGHFEAILHCVAICKLFAIHLRQELLCIFNDFQNLNINTKSRCLLRIAVCRFKCIYVLLGMAFSFEQMICWNDNLFIFDLRDCSCQ